MAKGAGLTADAFGERFAMSLESIEAAAALNWSRDLRAEVGAIFGAACTIHRSVVFLSTSRYRWARRALSRQGEVVMTPKIMVSLFVGIAMAAYGCSQRAPVAPEQTRSSSAAMAQVGDGGMSQGLAAPARNALRPAQPF